MGNREDEEKEGLNINKAGFQVVRDGGGSKINIKYRHKESICVCG